jgi:5-methyltetrahydropteroyltriglutamate--homocysteine methyltransferase
MADRILTTHIGSLPRPVELLDAMKARLAGRGGEEGTYDALVRRSVQEIVDRQIACGLDIVSDGELPKPGFFTYAQERLDGFTPRPGAGPRKWADEIDAFPEYYEDYFARAMGGGGVAPMDPLFCVAPVRYRGEAALARDLETLRAALNGKSCADAFVPSVSPSGVGYNDFYGSEEEYIFAVAEAMRTEYLAIIDAGFMLQVDEPFIADIFVEPDLDDTQKARQASMYVEAINHALRGIPPERVRMHTCYGINEGPRIHEAGLHDVIGYMLQVDAGSYSFEAANCRHEHEYHLWEEVRLPEGKNITPGVVTHAGNIVEHPELVAERIVRFARLVGRDNVIAAPDCGFSSQACYKTEVHPKVMWAKFSAMVEGARLASRKLWSRAA